MANRLQNTVNWVVLTAEVSHLFCCGIPIVFSVLSLLSSVGIIVSMPLGVEHLHHVMHDYEKPMILFSAIIVLLGWVMHIIAMKMDCRATGCGHEPCAPKKKRSSKILMVATALFALNLCVYFFLHA